MLLSLWREHVSCCDFIFIGFSDSIKWSCSYRISSLLQLAQVCKSFSSDKFKVSHYSTLSLPPRFLYFPSTFFLYSVLKLCQSTNVKNTNIIAVNCDPCSGMCWNNNTIRACISSTECLSVLQLSTLLHKYNNNVNFTTVVFFRTFPSFFL